MTDITELAQSLKAAAEHYQSVQGIARYSKTADAKERFLELANPANVLALVEALEKAQRHIGELERKEEALRPVGVMSEKAYHRLENRESRFIALWPRPEIYLPRKRPEDGVIVYARTAATTGIKWEAE
ncbi:ead/Ea22-like family protein [Klebsiella aerogenes]